MGYALAEAAMRRGARTVLVSGPTDLRVPEGVDWIPVRSTEEMRHAVNEQFLEATIVVMAAAVADYRPATTSASKLKREGEGLTLTLEPTPDILAEISSNKGGRILVGFAAETDRVAENARGKMLRKGADIIVANDVTQEGAGFDTDTNIVTMFLRDGREIPVPKMSKFDVANRIFDQILAIRKSS
jgi:phosphopantothenoylcysteine decarboxylase/phosphopantothenate--cysteine ligase